MTFGLWNGRISRFGSRGGGVIGPVLRLSSSTISDTASIGDTVGTLSVSGGTGSYTYSFTSNPGTLFSITGSTLKVAASLTAGSYSITVKADNGVDTPISRAFLISVTAPMSYHLLASLGSFALTGIDASFSDHAPNQYSLSVAAGSFALTGMSAGLARQTAGQYTLSASVGAFTLTGVAMTPVVDTVFSVDVGSFALSGKAAGFLYSRKLPTSVGAFTLTGNSAGLTKQNTGAYTLTASAGSFALTGMAATLTDTPAPASFGITYVDNKNSVASSTSYTFTGATALNIGTPDANRRVVLALGIRGTTAISITSVTVDYGTGPQAATKVVERNVTNAQDTSLWQVDAPTGTTATVVVTLANAATRVAIASYSLITTTPTAASTASSASVSPSNTVTVPAGGGSIIASFVTGGTSATPSNYTEDIDIIVPTTTINLTTGHDTTNTGSVTYTVTWAVTPSNPNAVFAAWGP